MVNNLKCFLYNIHYWLWYGENTHFLLVRVYIDRKLLEGKNREQNKLLLHLLFDLTIPFLGIYPRGILTNMLRNMNSRMFLKHWL